MPAAPVYLAPTAPVYLVPAAPVYLVPAAPVHLVPTAPVATTPLTSMRCFRFIGLLVPSFLSFVSFFSLGSFFLFIPFFLLSLSGALVGGAGRAGARYNGQDDTRDGGTDTTRVALVTDKMIHAMVGLTQPDPLL